MIFNLTYIIIERGRITFNLNHRKKNYPRARIVNLENLCKLVTRAPFREEKEYKFFFLRNDFVDEIKEVLTFSFIQAVLLESEFTLPYSPPSNTACLHNCSLPLLAGT